MPVRQADGWFAPTERKTEPDGSVMELSDIPLAPPALGAPHSRVRRKEQLAALAQRQRGTLLGPHQGLQNETPPALARARQCARAAFARTLGDGGEPHSWSIQPWNGAGEQPITFFLPSPFLDIAREQGLREPGWSHLALWNELRARYLGESVAQPLPRARGAGSCA